MFMSGSPAVAGTVCLVACLALVLAEHRDWSRAKAAFKVLASTAFVVLAWQLGATASAYGRLMLLALGLSWVGDVLLLSSRDRFFLPGIAAFLLAHVVFAIAFARHPLSVDGLALAIAGMSVVGLLVVRWLWRHLAAFYRIAVSAYVGAIVAMCSVAIAVGAASGAWLLASGALAFAVSDVSVARDRFVAPGFVNRAWGLPLYYAAQVVLAWSVAAPP
jgi:uncharacterized membrane protein YhhN